MSSERFTESELHILMKLVAEAYTMRLETKNMPPNVRQVWINLEEKIRLLLSQGEAEPNALRDNAYANRDARVSKAIEEDSISANPHEDEPQPTWNAGNKQVVDSDVVNVTDADVGRADE